VELPLKLSVTKDDDYASYAPDCDLYLLISFICDLLKGECKKGILYKKASSSRKIPVGVSSHDQSVKSLCSILEECQLVCQDEFALFMQFEDTAYSGIYFNNIPRFFHSFALLLKLAMLYSISNGNPDLLQESFARLASLVKVTISSCTDTNQSKTSGTELGQLGVSGYLDIFKPSKKQLALSQALEATYTVHIRSLVIFCEAMKTLGKYQYMHLLEKTSRL
jgi:hypothetical protein